MLADDLFSLVGVCVGCVGPGFQCLQPVRCERLPGEFDRVELVWVVGVGRERGELYRACVVDTCTSF